MKNIIARYNNNKKEALIASAFLLIEAAKNQGCYHIANRIFAWLSEQDSITWGLEVLEGEQNGWTDMDGYFIEGTAIHDSCIESDHYHSLMTLRRGDEYACIPFPMVSESRVKKVLRRVRPNAVTFRIEHERQPKGMDETPVWTREAYEFFMELDVSYFFLLEGDDNPYFPRACHAPEELEVFQPNFYNLNCRSYNHETKEMTEETWHFCSAVEEYNGHVSSLGAVFTAVRYASGEIVIQNNYSTLGLLGITPTNYKEVEDRIKDIIESSVFGADTSYREGYKPSENATPVEVLKPNRGRRSTVRRKRV